MGQSISVRFMTDNVTAPAESFRATNNAIVTNTFSSILFESISILHSCKSDGYHLSNKFKSLLIVQLVLCLPLES